ncbi:MAG: aminomethyl-transferring glycine dehydrogenase subunit GcvPA [Candidatus Binatia bacterium]|nr:aminomethyl-transferring glycine dehydrogenase subunit GcvPA [Candidatus Binatia bacterium]
MRYIPHTDHDIAAMLETIGIATVEELFTAIPAELRARAAIDLPPGRSEASVRAHLAELAALNRVSPDLVTFLGAGAYPHYVPAVVEQIIQRAEFATAYTPYQAEVSQGTLQSIFEFQSLVAALFGLEVANASMYDGASATAEAVLMAKRVLPTRPTVLLPRSLHPQYRQVVHSYLDGLPGTEIVELPWAPNGQLDLTAFSHRLDQTVSCVVVGYPNVFGVIEDVAQISTAAHQVGALVVTVTTEALALGLLKPPGALGADIAVAEGQSFGMPVSYGGPGVGLFACRQRLLRNMPGRLVGETVDHDGRRGFVLTLATREQHIRRERATSNICTNQGLCALAATVFLCLMGKQGLRELALRNVKNSHYTHELLQRTGQCRARFSAPFFNEFVIQVPHARAVWQRLKTQQLIAGLVLEDWYPDLTDCLLLCVTEMHRKADIDRLVRGLGAIDEERQAGL